MSWTLMERIHLVLAGSSPESPLPLLREAADYIADLEAIEEGADEAITQANEARTAFADLARDLRDVLVEHGI